MATRFLKRGAMALFVAALSVYGADALDLRPVAVPATISGVAIRVSVKSSVDLRTEAQAVEVQFAADGDLSDLQSKLLQIVRASPLPSNNCAGRNDVNLVVNSVDDARLTPSGDTALAMISGRVTLWGCARVFGEDVKTKLLSSNVSISAPLSLYLATDRSIAGRLAGPVEISTGDDRIRALLQLVVGDYQHKIGEALARLLEAGNASIAIPPLEGVDAVFHAVSLRADGGTMHVVVEGRGRASAGAIDRLLEQINRSR